ncbi:GDSL-type esterase/lipase family protein [Paenibacillus tengchongensis]|uniref:GDSL-type esterase/lipase family protein n=1 Tax=Paenibacillus tengchongensis TaxID=2608684 RepID=UPI00124D9E69|nr:GDSL-type esterase/lipase family protein [Paenibacillus tengchongensis]
MPDNPFSQTPGEGIRPYRFNFAVNPKEGYIQVPFDPVHGAVPYDPERGYGFARHTLALPPRRVHTSAIVREADGFTITEPATEEDDSVKKDHYNRFGMAFRVKAPPGAYRIQVTLTPASAEATIAVSGMNTAQLSSISFWDAAKLVPNRTQMRREGRMWCYDYVNGREVVDIELEPDAPGETVGLAEIVLTPLPPLSRPAPGLPTIFTLGDSTVKSYIFAEAPMSGWGQVLPGLFDLNRVKVINYAMGGRSFKSAYSEGRLNDILMTGCSGDYVLIQFGHNDESEDEARRFGRGATEAMYRTYLEEVYLPAIRARGLIPVLVTPMSRVDGGAGPGRIYTDSFRTRRFPQIMRELAGKHGITLVDLNRASIDYYNEIGVEATTAGFMSIEAGETPGKTNDGSYAGGHPARKNDGTHFKECLSKQFARMIVSGFVQLAAEGDPAAAELAGYLRPDVHEAFQLNDWSATYPEIARDIVSGPGAYYRNQIEKLLQLGVLLCDAEGWFHPEQPVSGSEFAQALSNIMGTASEALKAYGEPAALTRETMGAMLLDAYQMRFTEKPGYMTDYNGEALGPDDPGYDPYLAPEARGIMYYPLVSFAQLTDTAQIAPVLMPKIRRAYELGLLRAERGIRRGELAVSTELAPRMAVTRGAASKALYYMWVLVHPADMENHLT